MRLTRKLLALATLGAVAGAASAQTLVSEPGMPTSTPIARADVRAATAAAVAAGQIPRGEGLPIYPSHFESTRSRASVQSETIAAVAAGQIARGDAPAAVSDFRALKTRAEVRAETLAAMRLNLIPRGDAPQRQATPAELERIRMAGERARADGSLAASL